ncbi:MAG: helix-turn-helix transcriptional regulator [Lachnospiraceae bacterium]|nr:helix-turn-helix transcriptional regulator [Lachnospiraceae bacterium]
MMHAYDRVYLDRARTSLGRMLDFAVHDLKFTITDFFKMFIQSGISNRFAEGDFTVLAGRSGVELAYEVCEKEGKNLRSIKPNYTYDRSEEYWTGWALAYYQWETGLSFEEIARHVPIVEIQALYSPYHEMDIRHFVDKVNELYKMASPESKLKVMRQRAGLSQRELAELTNIPVRTIQQYEQRQKSINRAQAYYLLLLAKTLCCDVEELLEKVE